MLRRDRDPDARELVAECDAFITGRYAEHLLARERAVPAWAWTNLLAHSSEADLHEMVLLGAVRVPIAARLWWSARSYLAGEVLARVAPRQPLSSVQCVVLAPLEAELAARREVQAWRPARPMQWCWPGWSSVLCLVGRRERDERRTTPGHG
jgi:hypothetical protein